MLCAEKKSAIATGLCACFVVGYEAPNSRFALPTWLSSASKVPNDLTVICDEPTESVLGNSVPEQEILYFREKFMSRRSAAVILNAVGLIKPEPFAGGSPQPENNAFGHCIANFTCDQVRQCQRFDHSEGSLSCNHVSVGTSPSVADSIRCASFNDGRRAPDATRETVATVVFTRVAKSAWRISRLFKYCFSAVMEQQLTDYDILRKMQFTQNGMDVIFGLRKSCFL